MRLGAIPEGFPNAICRAVTVQEQKTLDLHENEEKKKFAKIRESIIQEFPKVLQDEIPLEPMAGPEMEIKLRKDIKITPTKMYKARQVPKALEEPGMRLTDHLVERGILK